MTGMETPGVNFFFYVLPAAITNTGLYSGKFKKGRSVPGQLGYGGYAGL